MNLRGHIPIYKKLIEFYRNRIISQEYLPGAKIDSINKIMSRHQVSRETAKRVLQALIAENLVISQPGRGTFINGVTSMVKKWGMVIPFYSTNIEQLISEISKQAQFSGRKLEYFLHYNNPDEEMRSISQLIQKGYEAIIIVPNYDESITGEFYRRLNPGKTKIVLADNTMAGSYFNYAIQSYDLGVTRAVDYLAEWEEKGNYLLLSSERWQGRNLVFDHMKQTFEMILEMKYPDRKLFHSADINDLSVDFFRGNNIRGVLAIQDSLTVRLIGKLKKWGFSIPEEIRLVSYGNTELSELFTPAITVVDCQYEEMANKIGQLINETSNLIGKQIIIQPKLIVRET
ncbi:MAG: GntR family transcriptional regulator [Labilibaculum sp.]|nr:GntR family transcriptional regulator [Labilibaculum sp.]MBI9060045.1 GntR family transcriptional regulator [Labilibaculum sp.]